MLSRGPIELSRDHDSCKSVLFDVGVGFLREMVFKYDAKPAVGVAWNVDGGSGDEIVPVRNSAHAT
jgi:hypothetical protein